MKSLKTFKHCEEKWSDMTEDEKGKFCLECSKIVIDFSKLSQEEIINFLKTSKSKICARVSNEQINSPLVEFKKKPKKTLNHFSKFAASFVIATSILTIHSCESNETKQPIHFDQHSNKSSEENALIKEGMASANDHTENSFHFKGTILSQITNKPLENAKITFISLLKTYTAFTDKNGKFVLKIPLNIIQLENVVNVSFKNIFDEYNDNFVKLDNHYKSENIVVLKNELENFKFKAEKEIIYIGMVELNEEDKNRKPVVLIDGEEIEFDEFEKIRTGIKESYEILGNKEQYYLRPEVASVLYDKEAKDGIILLIESKN